MTAIETRRDTPSRSRPSILLLGIASGLSPFGMAIVVPALPGMANRFSADFSVIQFVISAYLFGLACAQPVTGFFCDRFGRRRVMLIGFALFSVASIACAYSASLPTLIALRFLQAVGVSVGTVASRAIVRDTRGTEGSAEAMSYIAAAMGIAPVLAPVLGGWLDSFDGHKAIFLVSAAMGCAVFVGMYLRLSETLQSAESTHWSDWLGSYATLLKSPTFVGYTLTYGFVQGSFFSFLAVGAAIFSSYFGMGPRLFGVMWGLMAVAYVSGAALGGRFTARVGTKKVVSIGITMTLVAGWVLLALVTLVGVSLPAVLVPMIVLMAASGSVIPGAMAGALFDHPRIAGTGSGLSSAISITLGGMFTIVSGLIYNGNFTPIAILIVIATTLTAASWMLVQSVNDSRPI